jgi:hypothetical protein
MMTRHELDNKAASFAVATIRMAKTLSGSASVVGCHYAKLTVQTTPRGSIVAYMNTNNLVLMLLDAGGFRGLVDSKCPRI